MKSLLIPVCLFFAACSVNKSAKQSSDAMPLKDFKGDTASYIRANFKDNKQKYVDKELGLLLKDLQMPVKSFLFSPVFGKDSVASVHLSVYSLQEAYRRSEVPEEEVYIIPAFRTMLPLKEVGSLVKKNKGAWTKDEQRYFEHVIIKDIVIYYKEKGKVLP